MDITGWRRKIDEIDTAMLHLLNLRAELAIEVARMKNLEGLALRVPAREHAIVSRMKQLNPGPLESRAIVKIYEVILAESVRAQQRYGGPAGPSAKSGRVSRADRVKKKRR
jgi:chorismate mutase/prephenate dehydratase